GSTDADGAWYRGKGPRPGLCAMTVSGVLVRGRFGPSPMDLPRIGRLANSSRGFRRAHWGSSLLPKSLDFLIPLQDRLSRHPGERRGHISRVAPFPAGPGNLLVVGPGDVRDVPVLDADSVEGLGGRPIEKWRGRGLMEKHGQEFSFFW